ncbi:MAG TPA: glycolate oxidase subunit GlcE [Pseudoduganella sp.]
MQEIVEQFREQVRAASATGAPLRIRGGGTKDWYGQALVGSVLDTRAYAGVVDYEPTELVITVRCGTLLSEVEALLTQHRQMLAFEPPRFGSASTIGGVVACGLSGPRRASAGAVRDFVLGAQLMDGRGELLNFGGQVMKNVAGYDVSRLLCGSLGTLGLITEVSLKVLPMPFREETIRFEMDEITALSRMNAWAGQPLPVSATCWRDGVLSVRLSGADAAVRAALLKLGGEQVADGAGFWAALRDQTHSFFSGHAAQIVAAAGGGAHAVVGVGGAVDADAGAGGALWRLSVPSTASALILGGEQLIEWGGAQRWLRTPAGADASADAATIRRTVAAAGGHATLYRRAGSGILDAAPGALAATAADDARGSGYSGGELGRGEGGVGARAAAAGGGGAAGAGDGGQGHGAGDGEPVFHPLAPAVARIHERLKAGFDPSGVFNPGRMY